MGRASESISLSFNYVSTAEIYISMQTFDAIHVSRGTATNIYYIHVKSDRKVTKKEKIK